MGFVKRILNCNFSAPEASAPIPELHQRDYLNSQCRPLKKTVRNRKNDIVSLKVRESKRRTCKHFPGGTEDEVCEFCTGARLIEESARNNAAMLGMVNKDIVQRISRALEKGEALTEKDEADLQNLTLSEVHSLSLQYTPLKLLDIVKAYSRTKLSAFWTILFNKVLDK